MQKIELEFLTLSNYRNYEHLSLSFDDNIQVITGANGAGKTTILDAIYYICNGKSYFTHLDRHIYKYETDFFRVEGRFSKDDDKLIYELVSQVSKTKSFKINEKKLKSLSELVGQVPAFMIAPRDILILVESSIERRKVMDRTISLADKSYLLNLMKYNKLLKQRNAYLKNVHKIGESQSLVLESIDKNMLEPAKYIYNKRKEYLTDLAPIMKEHYEDISKSSESVTLAYRSHLHDGTMESLLKDSVRQDHLLRKTTKGIHKDDITIFIDSKPIKKYASEGQLKSAVIALKLAQMEWIKKITGIKPILLMDDIFDKLDKNRVRQLLELAKKEMASQIFITDTDKSRVVEALQELSLSYKSYLIEDGAIIT